MLLTCVMRHAWTHKLQMSGPTVYSYTVVFTTARCLMVKLKSNPASENRLVIQSELNIMVIKVLCLG